MVLKRKMIKKDLQEHDIEKCGSRGWATEREGLVEGLIRHCKESGEVIS